MYFSQGLAYSDDNAFIADEGETEAGLHEAIANFNWRPHARFRVAGQGYYRKLGNLDPSDWNIDYLFAEYRLPIPKGNLALSVGRNKNDQGFFTAQQDTLFTRPGVLLPQSVYLSYTRDGSLHLDGAKLSGNHFFGDQHFSWDVAYGALDITENLLRNSFGDASADVSDSRSFSASAQWVYRPWMTLKLSYSDSKFDVDPLIAGLPGNSKNERWIAGYRGEWSHWEWIAEYAETPIDVSGQVPAIVNGQPVIVDGAALTVPVGINRTQQAWYVQSNYRLSEPVSLMLRYGSYYTDKDDKSGSSFVAQGQPAWVSWSKIWSVGGRWHINNDWLLALEMQHIDGHGVFPVRMRNVDGTKRYSQLYLAQLAYRFQW
ncbi:hypothetical protein [Ferrimonas pelagia]|uniref:Alginate export domain-containing protein n=1 Tax=Ferrimonas pelagia TaxID=1177826 RepID=A0ABP9EDN6_9GAMM